MSPKLAMALRIVCIVMISIAIGGVAGWYIHINYTNSLPTKLIEVRKNSPELKFINPLLLVDAPRQSPEYNDLKKTYPRSCHRNNRTGMSKTSPYISAT